MSQVTTQREIDLKQRATRQGYKHPRASQTDCAVTNAKTAGHKPRETPGAPLSPYEEYGNSSPHGLAHEILSDIHDGNRDLESLVNAIHSIDQFRLTNPRSDKKPLITLLRSRGTTRAENELIADLIGRVVLTWPVGRRRRPAYMISENDHDLRNARADVRELRRAQPGLSVADAVERVAEELNIPHNRLLDFCQGRARSARGKKKW